MDLATSIITLLVGAAVFIVGMNLMSSGLKKSTGKGVRRLFKKTQNNPFAGLGIGAATTALVQSSATTSIMALGFIATGVMTIYQGVSVILGAYIGTTVTGLIASLSSFSFSKYFVLFAVIGVVMMFFKKEKIKNFGEIIAGLGLLFFGLSTMSRAVSASESPEMYKAVVNIFNTTSFPLLLFLIGAVFTALVQSSSATTGIVIVMVGSSAISLESGFYLMLGAGFGTIVPTLIATIGGNVNVKRTTAMCVFIRFLSTILTLVIVWVTKHGAANYISDFYSNVFKSNELALAMFAVTYNIIFMLGFIPLIKPLEKLFTKLIKDKDAEEKQKAVKFIDDHLLNTPSVAMMQVKNEILDMYDLALSNLQLGYEEMLTQEMSQAKTIAKVEEMIDYKNNAITKFLIALSNRVGNEDERIIGSYFHIINDIERIGDHAFNFSENAAKMIENELKFSDKAREEFKDMDVLLDRMCVIARDAIAKNRSENAGELEYLERQTDKLKAALATAHFQRITNNQCKMELSPYYSTFLAELERVGDHLMNIGYSFINPTGDEIL